MSCSVGTTVTRQDQTSEETFRSTLTVARNRMTPIQFYGKYENFTAFRRVTVGINFWPSTLDTAAGERSRKLIVKNA
jgi:hypothetical protein